MAKTVTFIKKQSTQSQEPGSPLNFVRYTEKELVAIKRAGGEGFFAVPESHAEMNMRRNAAYQEVDIDRITVLAAKSPSKAATKAYRGADSA